MPLIVSVLGKNQALTNRRIRHMNEYVDYTYGLSEDEKDLAKVEECKMYANAVAALCTSYSYGRYGFYATL